MERVVVLGSTGSIGTQSIEVLKGRETYKIEGLSAVGTKPRILKAQIEAIRPLRVAILNVELAKEIRLAYPWVDIFYDQMGFREFHTAPSDIVINGIDGFAGIAPTVASLPHTKKLAIANKESIVYGWSLIEQERDKILPVDSEHFALYQLLKQRSEQPLLVLITASGGAVRDLLPRELAQATAQQILNHPNWDMGGLVTVNSSTMVNKAVEVIEARNLFALSPTQVDAVLHKESLIHAMVHFKDGTTQLNMFKPDMRIPIAGALGESISEKERSCFENVDFSNLNQLSFGKIEEEKYPLFSFFLDEVAKTTTAIVELNTINEIAVRKFLRGEMRFGEIEEFVKKHYQGKKIKISSVEELKNEIDSVFHRVG